MNSTITILTLMFATLAGLAHADTGAFYPIDPRTTFQHTCEDPAGRPTLLNGGVIDLDAEGYAPGDTIRVQAVGDFAFVTGGPEDGNRAIGVFSSDGVVDPDRSLVHRVPGAIQSDAPDFVTGAPNRCADETTDIPEDFLCDGAAITVPDRGDGRAAFLIVSAFDEYYSDNEDTDADFGVEVSALPLCSTVASLTADYRDHMLVGGATSAQDPVRGRFGGSWTFFSSRTNDPYSSSANLFALVALGGPKYGHPGQRSDLPMIRDRYIFGPNGFCGNEGVPAANELGFHPGYHHDSHQYLAIRWIPGYSTGSPIELDLHVDDVGNCGGNGLTVAVFDGDGNTVLPRRSIASNGRYETVLSIPPIPASSGLWIMLGNNGSYAADSSAISAVIRSTGPDLDRDGDLDLDDITAYVSAFSSGSVSADLNRDDLLDLADITLFANSFTAGCP